MGKAIWRGDAGNRVKTGATDVQPILVLGHMVNLISLHGSDFYDYTLNPPTNNNGHNYPKANDPTHRVWVRTNIQ